MQLWGGLHLCFVILCDSEIALGSPTLLCVTPYPCSVSKSINSLVLQVDSYVGWLLVPYCMAVWCPGLCLPRKSSLTSYPVMGTLMAAMMPSVIVEKE